MHTPFLLIAMRKHIFILLGGAFLFFACANPKVVDAGQFREYEVRGKLYELEIFAEFPRIVSMDSLLMIYSDNSLGKLATIYSPHENMKKVGDWGNRGRGPGEFFVLEINSTYENRFFIHNLNQQELVVMELTKEPDSVKVKEMERFKFEYIVHDNIGFEDRYISRLDDRHYVGVSFGGAGKFFSLYDDRMNWLGHFGDGPVDADLDPLNSRRSLSGHIATRDGAFVYSPMNLPIILFFRKEADTPERVWEDTFYNSYLRIDNRQINFDDDRTIGMVRDLEMGEKYIYVLFLDVPLADVSMASAETSAANIMFVYDHQGNRVARLNLDYRINKFCVTADEKTIYALAPTPEDRIVSFELPVF